MTKIGRKYCKVNYTDRLGSLPTYEDDWDNLFYANYAGSKVSMLDARKAFLLVHIGEGLTKYFGAKDAYLEPSAEFIKDNDDDDDGVNIEAEKKAQYIKQPPIRLIWTIELDSVKKLKKYRNKYKSHIKFQLYGEFILH